MTLTSAEFDNTADDDEDWPNDTNRRWINRTEFLKEKRETENNYKCRENLVVSAVTYFAVCHGIRSRRDRATFL